MTEHTNFLNMFSLYMPPEEAQDLLSQAAIRHARVDPLERRVEAELESGVYIPRRVLDAAWGH